MVGPEADVAAANSLDSGEIWDPRWRSAGLRPPAQTPEAGPAQRDHGEAEGLLLQPCLPDCDGHLQDP